MQCVKVHKAKDLTGKEQRERLFVHQCNLGFSASGADNGSNYEDIVPMKQSYKNV